jgi:integrase
MALSSRPGAILLLTRTPRENVRSVWSRSLPPSRPTAPGQYFGSRLDGAKPTGPAWRYLSPGRLEQNPMAGVKLPSQKNRRTGVSSVAMARELIVALPRSEQPLWAAALYSELRRGELQALRAGDVDFERNEI